MHFRSYAESDSILHQPNFDKLFFISISTLIGIFLVIRAIYVPLVHDEIATFYYFVQSGKVSPFLTNSDTNNHFLNSALTWIFYTLFGPSPISLRLSNLIFIPLFFYFLFKITNHLQSRIFRYVLFLSLAFTLHFVEYLALSRGYGISMAFLTGSICYLLEGLVQKRNRYLILSLLCIFIASLANLALINTYALLLVFISMMLIINNKKNILRVISILVISGFMPISIILAQILYIKSKNGLIAGAPVNFWKTTITSLTAYLFETSFPSGSLIAAGFLSIILITSLIALYKLGKPENVLTSKAFLFFYLLAGNISIILALGIFLGVNYPDDRIGLYLYPLAICSLVFILDYLLISKKWRIAVAVPFLIIPVHFFIYINTTYSIWYKVDVIPQRFYDEVMKHHKPGTIPPTLAGHGMRIFCWSYLNYMHGGYASQVFFTHFPDYNADYMIVNLKMVPDWHLYYDTIDYDAVSERHLLKIHSASTSQVLITKQVEPVKNYSSEYLLLAEGTADSLRNKILRIDFRLSLFSAQKPFISRIVFDVWDKQPKSLGFEYIHFDWLRNAWNGEPGNFVNCMLVSKVPPEASTYKIYIWNIDKTAFNLNGGNIKINEIK